MGKIKKDDPSQANRNRVRRAQELISDCTDRLMDVMQRMDSLYAPLSGSERETDRKLLAQVMMNEVTVIETDLKEAAAVCEDYLATCSESSSFRNSVRLSLGCANELAVLCSSRRQWLSKQKEAIRVREQSRDAAGAISDLGQRNSLQAGLEKYAAQVRRAAPDKTGSE